jgi:hypothetical protein
MGNIIDLATHRRTRWANLPKVTEPCEALFIDDSRWKVLTVWPDSDAALCEPVHGRKRKEAIPLTMLRRAP